MTSSALCPTVLSFQPQDNCAHKRAAPAHLRAECCADVRRMTGVSQTTMSLVVRRRNIADCREQKLCYRIVKFRLIIVIDRLNVKFVAYKDFNDVIFR